MGRVKGGWEGGRVGGEGRQGKTPALTPPVLGSRADPDDIGGVWGQGVEGGGTEVSGARGRDDARVEVDSLEGAMLVRRHDR